MVDDRRTHPNLQSRRDFYYAEGDINIYHSSAPLVSGSTFPGTTRNTVKLFMGESGNRDPGRPLIVETIELGDDADDVEESIRALHRRLSAMRSLDKLPGFEEFRRRGFYSENYPQQVSISFLELIRNTIFRISAITTDRTKLSGITASNQINVMRVKLLSDLLIQHRNKPNILLHIEQSPAIQPLVRQLADNATKQAHKTLDTTAPLPQLTINMVTKADCMSMTIVDYTMSVIARWLRTGRTTNPEDQAYQDFREIEPFISVLYSLEHGRISSRKDPLKLCMLDFRQGRAAVNRVRECACVA